MFIKNFQEYIHFYNQYIDLRFQASQISILIVTHFWEIEYTETNSFSRRADKMSVPRHSKWRSIYRSHHRFFFFSLFTTVPYSDWSVRHKTKLNGSGQSRFIVIGIVYSLQLVPATTMQPRDIKDDPRGRLWCPVITQPQRGQVAENRLYLHVVTTLILTYLPFNVVSLVRVL